MKWKHVTRFVALALVAGCVALTFSAGAGPAWAFPARNGQLHLTKECSQFTGQPGAFCTFTRSNLAPLPVGSKVFYDQAAGIPDGLLDSNVVLDAGSGNRALGRCTLDLATGHGLCTFSDGTGDFVGFEARVDVICPGVACTWEGPYKFNPKPRK